MNTARSTDKINISCTIWKKNELPGLLMLVDFQKAFDSVSWTFLNNVLKFFNFGKDFCHWINILNKNIQATILQSGHLSYFFTIHRGCRQGDSIASYLFLLAAQILYLMITVVLMVSQ